MRKLRKGIRIVLTSLTSLFGAVILAVGALLFIPVTEFTKVDHEIASSDWMKNLDDNKKLNEIYLPGTHDSGTTFVQLAYFSKCQGLDIKQQLEAGYRFLDIRLALQDNGEFYLQHGFTKCKTGWFGKYLTLNRVLDDCYSFLNANSSETIVFSVKQEDGDQPISEFQNALNTQILKNSSKWLLTDEIPTLQESRGKIVLMRRYSDGASLGKKSGIALSWGDQGSIDNINLNYSTSGASAGSMNLFVQDRYSYNNEEKWNAFIAETGSMSENLVINYSSTKGHATFGHPYKYAKYMNPKILELYSSQRPSGWTIIDFGNAKIAQSIYKWNFAK